MVIIDGVTIKNPCKEGRPPDQQHLVSELPFEMLRVCVFQAVQERWGTGAISLRGLREAIEWRLGVSLAHRKPAIRQLAEEAADVLSQLPSALNDSGRGRELFLSLSDVESARAWTGVWEPLPHQDRLRNRTRTYKTLALNVTTCDASLLICEAPRPLLPLSHFWRYGCQKGACSNQPPLRCMCRGTNNRTPVIKTIFTPMLCMRTQLFGNACCAWWQSGNVIMNATLRVCRVISRMTESHDVRAHLWEVGHGKALYKTLMTDAISVVFDRGKFTVTLSACRLEGQCACLVNGYIAGDT